MSQPERITSTGYPEPSQAITSYPVPWQATTRLRYESDLKRQAERLRINPGMPDAGQTLVAYDGGTFLSNTIFYGSGKDFELDSIADVLHKGIGGLTTHIGKQAGRFVEYSSSLYHAVKDLHRNPSDRYAEVRKTLPELEKAFKAAETAIAHLRKAEIKDRIPVAKKLGSWISEEEPPIWVKVDEYTTLDKGRHLAGCSLLKLTGLMVDDRVVDGVTQAPLAPQIQWQGTGSNGVTGVYRASIDHTIYVPSGPREELPLQFAYPRGHL